MKGTLKKPITAEDFKKKVHVWAKRLRVKPTQIRVQRMTRKWGSCSTAGWVSFSEELLSQHLAFQNYVIVHELLHLKVPNHGKLFKSFLAAYIPGWKAFGCARMNVISRGANEA